MGSPKGLLDYQGHPWLLEQLGRFRAASGQQAIVVLGFDHKSYFRRIPWLPSAEKKAVLHLGLETRVVINKTPEHGPFSSLQCAAAFLPKIQAKDRRLKTEPSFSLKAAEGTEPNLAEGRTPKAEGCFLMKNIPGAFILPIDVPGPGIEVYSALLKAFRGKIEAAIPRYQSKGGHPVLLSCNFLQTLTRVSPGSEWARLDHQIRNLPDDRKVFLSVADPRVVLNMNFLEEFQAYSRQ
jgi:CTP:molybdopterin cytidylyltransferase MocA